MLSDTIPPSGDLSKDNSRIPSPKPKSKSNLSNEAIPESIEIENDDVNDEDEDEIDDEDEVDNVDYNSDGEVVNKSDRPSATTTEKPKRSKRPSKFKAKRDEMELSKNEDSIKRFSYLIGQTDLFRHFIDKRKERDPSFAAMIEQSEFQNQSKKNKKKANEGRHRKSEKEEDEELLEEEDDQPFAFTETPGCK